jgi:hypothetical protein
MELSIVNSRCGDTRNFVSPTRLGIAERGTIDNPIVISDDEDDK